MRNVTDLEGQGREPQIATYMDSGRFGPPLSLAPVAPATTGHSCWLAPYQRDSRNVHEKVETSLSAERSTYIPPRQITIRYLDHRHYSKGKNATAFLEVAPQSLCGG